jgi:hypothetical protein
MAQWNDERLPDDLREVADRLRAEREQASPTELDGIKLRAMARASRGRGSGQRKGSLMRPKLVSMLLVLGLVVSGGTAGVIAGGPGGGGGNSAGKSEYKPGKGCGDKNHTHTGPPGNPSNTDCPPQSGKK